MDDPALVGVGEALGELSGQGEDRVDVAPAFEVQQGRLGPGDVRPPAASDQLGQPSARGRGRGEGPLLPRGRRQRSSPRNTACRSRGAGPPGGPSRPERCWSAGAGPGRAPPRSGRRRPSGRRVDRPDRPDGQGTRGRMAPRPSSAVRWKSSNQRSWSRRSVAAGPAADRTSLDRRSEVARPLPDGLRGRPSVPDLAARGMEVPPGAMCGSGRPPGGSGIHRGRAPLRHGSGAGIPRRRSRSGPAGSSPRQGNAPR